MSSQESEQMLILLKELTMLKALDGDYESGSKSGAEYDAHRLRQQRHQEINEEIKALGQQKKNDTEQHQLPEQDSA